MKQHSSTKKTQASPSITKMRGVLVVLDVLGFKEKTNALQKEKYFSTFLDIVVDKKRTFGAEPSHDIYDAIRSPNADVILLSDTLIFYQSETEGHLDCDLLITAATFVNNTILHGLESGIVMRGAMSFGEILICRKPYAICGPAINEAAVEHETTDWIGCHLTTSAGTIIDTAPSCKHERIGKYFAKHAVPFKSGNSERYAVNWLPFMAQHSITHHPYYYDSELKTRIAKATQTETAIKKVVFDYYFELLEKYKGANLRCEAKVDNTIAAFKSNYPN